MSERKFDVATISATYTTTGCHTVNCRYKSFGLVQLRKGF